MRAVFGFGRVNPITLGHSRLINRIVELGRGADMARFFVTRSHDRDRNPLTVEEKLAFIRRAFPAIDTRAVQTFFEATRSLAEAGFEEAVLVVGADRQAEFEGRFLPYAGTEALGLKRLTIVSIERPAGAVSATSARALAMTGNWEAFRKTVPGDDFLAADLFRTVRMRMGALDGDNDAFQSRSEHAGHDDRGACVRLLH